MKTFILLLTVTMVASRSIQTAKDGKSEKDLIMQNLKKLKELLSDKVKSTQSNSIGEDQAKAIKEEPSKEDRKAKSLNYYSYFPPPMVHLNYPSNLGYLTQSKDFRPIIPDEWLSRTEPFKRKTNQLVDSPTYYIRLPPNPYVFVPGMGYISRPPTMGDPELLNTIPSSPDKTNEISPDEFYHLPLNFVSNGKPTSVFQLPNGHVVRPKPEASIYSLNKGPYLFNGKPTDIYLLRNSLNSLYADALTNFYP